MFEGQNSRYPPNVHGVASDISSLGMLLFRLFNNDIQIENSLRYADDYKGFQVALSDRDFMSLQKHINRFYRWYVKWGLNINPKKCSMISFN